MEEEERRLTLADLAKDGGKLIPRGFLEGAMAAVLEKMTAEAEDHARGMGPLDSMWRRMSTTITTAAANPWPATFQWPYGTILRPIAGIAIGDLRRLMVVRDTGKPDFSAILVSDDDPYRIGDISDLWDRSLWEPIEDPWA